MPLYSKNHPKMNEIKQEEAKNNKNKNLFNIKSHCLIELLLILLHYLLYITYLKPLKKSKSTSSAIKYTK